MRPVAFKWLACAFSLLALLSSPCVLAADASNPDIGKTDSSKADVGKVFTYAIELNIPAEQRKMMEDHLDLYRWRGSERMDMAQLERLIKLAPAQIREFLSTEGYYSPHITAVLADKKTRRIVRLAVELGEPVRVASVGINVIGAFDDESALNLARLASMKSGWGLPAGSVFRHSDWESAKRQALKVLLLKDYPTASIAGSYAAVDPLTHTVALQITFDSGPGYTLGGLEIQGLTRYPRSLIDHMNPVKPGEPYSQAKLLVLQSRLQDSPYFSSVAVSVDTSSGQSANVPVRVEVVEVQSRKLGFGIGMSTDSGPRGVVEYSDLKVLDRALRLNSALKVDRKKQSLSGDMQFPLDEDGYLDGINSLYERTDIAGLVTHKLVFGAKRLIARGNTETVYGLNYSLERQNLNGAGSSVRNTLSPSYAFTLRNVDNMLNPSKGYLLNFQADVASRALLSDQDFVRGYGKGVYFYPLGRSDQLIVRGELGMVAARSRNGIGSSFLFRTGGDQTVRGYAYQSLGVQQAGAVVGGRYLAVGSAEYVHWLMPEWGGAVFVDAGDAADTLGKLKPVVGYGAGARWRSPIGPLNFDLAYGQQTKKLRLHFSLGFSF